MLTGRFQERFLSLLAAFFLPFCMISIGIKVRMYCTGKNIFLVSDTSFTRLLKALTELETPLNAQHSIL